MQFISASMIIALSNTYLVTAVAGAAGSFSDMSPARSEILGRTITKPVFRGELDGRAYEIEGTVTEVLAELEVRYPGRLAARNAAQASEPALEPRNKDGILCIPVPGQDWYYAWYDFINGGIAQLKDAGGNIGIGPKHCSLIYCNIDSGITLCNDNDYGISPGSAYISSYAQDIVNKCTHGTYGYPQITGGQMFDTDHYNIIVAACGPDPETDDNGNPIIPPNVGHGPKL